jgi:hypothetical protein
MLRFWSSETPCRKITGRQGGWMLNTERYFANTADECKRIPLLCGNRTEMSMGITHLISGTACESGSITN